MGLLLAGDVLVVDGHQAVGALHEAVELGLGVGTQQVGAGLGDEDVVLAAGLRFLYKEQLVTGLDDDSVVALHP